MRRAIRRVDAPRGVSVSAPRLRLVAWSDYLCPWCANASRRLCVIEDEFDEVEIDWRSYLLRPTPRETPQTPLAAAEQLEKFRRYAQSWRRPAAEADAAEFRFWELEARPPTHSVPAQVVAKAAARQGRAAFRAMHTLLLEAYFGQNRDISAAGELGALWASLELPGEQFPALEDPELLGEVMSDHRDAIDRGATGVPAVMMVGNDAVVVGAQPLETYRRWIERSLERLAQT